MNAVKVIVKIFVFLLMIMWGMLGGAAAGFWGPLWLGHLYIESTHDPSAGDAFGFLVILTTPAAVIAGGFVGAVWASFVLSPASGLSRLMKGSKYSGSIFLAIAAMAGIWTAESLTGTVFPIHVQNTSGLEEIKRLSPGGQVEAVAWNADGSRLAISSEPGGVTLPALQQVNSKELS